MAILRPLVLPDPLPADPFPLFEDWFTLAREVKAQPNPNAFSLATADATGRPSVRTILCKAIEAAAGAIVFFTNYQGAKGRDLDANPRAAAGFHWDGLDLQVRLEGPVSRTSAAESDAYFRTRPWVSRVGAWASDQSRPIESRAALFEKFNATMKRFGLDPANPPAPAANPEIPRPPHWGGYRLHGERVEMWVGAVGRLHDRAEWTRTLRTDAAPDAPFIGASPWRCTRVQP